MGYCAVLKPAEQCNENLGNRDEKPRVSVIPPSSAVERLSPSKGSTVSLSLTAACESGMPYRSSQNATLEREETAKQTSMQKRNNGKRKNGRFVGLPMLGVMGLSLEEYAGLSIERIVPICNMEWATPSKGCLLNLC